MGVKYVNRKGDTYFVFEGRTKTGKPKYYCSKKSVGVHVDQLPEGFELHESPINATVSVRRTRPTRIADFERRLLEQFVAEHSRVPTIVDVEDDSIVIYASDVNFEESTQLLTAILGERLAGRSLRTGWLSSHANYHPMLRFTLVDEDERLYSAERWCFLGRIDGWLELERRVPLELVGKRYLQHLGRDSFFDLH